LRDDAPRLLGRGVKRRAGDVAHHVHRHVGDSLLGHGARPPQVPVP